MEISLEEALDLLKRWQSESALLRVVIRSEEFSAESQGVVLSASSEEMHLRLANTDSRFPLTRAEFRYAEPNGPSEYVRQLQLHWPDESLCVLFERRSLDAKISLDSVSIIAAYTQA